MQRVDSFEKTLMLGGIGVGGEGDDRGWDGWMASLTLSELREQVMDREAWRAAIHGAAKNIINLILVLTLFWCPCVESSLVLLSVQFSSVQLLSRVRLFATPWITARQASLSITNSWSSLRLTSIESVMPSSHLILCRLLFLLPPIPPSIRVFSSESTLCMRWPKY